MQIRTLTLAGALAFAACARQGTPEVSSPAKGGLEELSLNSRVAEVRANTQFRVIMNDPLSSETAYPGQTFTATLATPLVTKDMRMAAPAGTRVNGHVTSVRTQPEPRIAVDFDTIETPGGMQKIDAHATTALDAPFGIASARDAREADADSVFRPGGGAIGGGPPAEDVGDHTAKVVIPKSSQVELVLVSPLTVILPEQPGRELQGPVLPDEE